MKNFNSFLLTTALVCSGLLGYASNSNHNLNTNESEFRLGNIRQFVTINTSSSIRGNLDLTINSDIRDNGNLVVQTANGRLLTILDNRSVPLARGENKVSLNLNLQPGETVSIRFTTANTNGQLQSFFTVPQFNANDIRSLVDLDVFTPSRGRAVIQLDSDLRDNGNLLLINLSTGVRTRRRILISRGQSNTNINLPSGPYVAHLRSANTVRRVSKRFMVR
ncbi:hypothetical protein [Aquimarina agarivorans]|uniref:hypothetical protein n=1 Tax=Aquimarina agarivorans TaxID=980584 RepID=UPI000248E5F8|nr:hypothetical protein [Aquimarina agarivorans]